MRNKPKTTLSLIIPVFNEQESLIPLYKQINDALREKNQYLLSEIIFINDGSTDDSLAILKSLHNKDPRVKIISFRTNLGKAAALNSGFKKAEGDFVITLDGDLQDGPENIFVLIERLQKGCDLVVGWKKIRHDPWTKRIPSRLFNYIVRSFSRLPLHDFNSGLKAMRKEVAQEIYLYGELHRFIPVLASQRGFTIDEVAVTHHPRKYGKSKYGIQRFFSGFFDFMTVLFLGSFGKRPLHLFGLLGILCILASILIGVYLTWLHFEGVSIGRRPILNLVILLFLGGLQMLLSGFIAEMIVSRRSPRDNDQPINYET